MKADLRGWTAVALAHDLPRGGVLRTFVDDRDLAVWRSRSGVVRAWDNRCPHRGMRLSFGFVRGESLTCIYHGWQYRTDGACRHIPAHPDLAPPRTLCTQAFSSVEKGSLVWVSLSDAGGEPDLGHAATIPVRSIEFDRSIAGVRAIAETAQFPIGKTWQPGEGSFKSIEAADRLIVREGEVDGERRTLLMVLQSLPDDRTAAHVLTSPEATPELKKTLSRWLERLRWFAENPDVRTQSWHSSGDLA